MESIVAPTAMFTVMFGPQVLPHVELTRIGIAGCTIPRPSPCIFSFWLLAVSKSEGRRTRESYHMIHRTDIEHNYTF